MHNRICAAALALLALAAVPAFAQAPAPFTSVVGTVTKIGDSAKTFGIKPDKSDETTVMVDPRTKFLRIPAGETDIKKATEAKPTDVGVGDRVLVRVQTANPTGLPAGTFVITKQADVTARNQRTAEEWQTQSVTGKVKSVNAAAKQMVIASSTAQGPARDVTLDLTGNVEYLRYNASAGKNEPSTFAAITVGDDVRLLGDKNADQTQVKVHDLVSNDFRSIPVQIKSIDAAAGEILATNLTTKKPITVTIRPDTELKRLDDATALAMARRLNPSYQGEGQGRGAARGGQGGGGNQAPQGAGQANIAGPDGAGRGQGGGRGFAGGRGGRGGRGGGAADPNRVLENQPSIELADLKAGDPVVVTGSPSADLAKLTAVSLVAGVEPILRAAPANGPDPLGGNWNFGGAAAPE